MGLVVAGLQVISLVLQVVLIAFLLRGPVRRYLFFLLYSSVYLVATIVQVLVYRLRGQSSLYRIVYWTGEVSLDLLLFLMVILLTYQALESAAARASAGRFLAGVAVIALLLPFVVFPDPFKPRWFNSTSQMLNFGGAILNLGLWGALIARKNRDPQLLTLSVGLGIVVTGAAIEYGLRAFITAGDARAVINLFSPVMHVASLVLWCWAFRPLARSTAPGTALPQHS